MFTSWPTAITQEIRFSSLTSPVPRLLVLREDLLDPFVGGNKWRKLQLNLAAFADQHKKVMLSFGGAWSNHLTALAAVCKRAGIPAVGVIRGDEELNNPSLSFMKRSGLKILQVSRSDYRLRSEPDFLAMITRRAAEEFFDPSITAADFYVIPEGGSNEAGVKGCEAISTAIGVDYDLIVAACGTGATLAGIARGLPAGKKAVGIPVLKGQGFLGENIERWGAPAGSFQLIHGYDHGGYAKSSSALLEFCSSFQRESHIPVEPVYTGKLFFALRDLFSKGAFDPASTVVALHSGGIFNYDLEA